jgi:DNA-directed RNA polymerase subunit M/transcription elongation factor TFIIS
MSCRDCGALLPVQKTGRPRVLCPKCFDKERQKYQNRLYLERKYPDKSQKEIFSLELQERIRRDRNLLKRHKEFMKREFRRTPGLWVLFEPSTAYLERVTKSKPYTIQRKRGKILNPWRRRLLKQLKDLDKIVEIAR